MPQLAHHMPSVPASGIRRIHEIALDLGLRDIIMLAVGEPDVPVAATILEEGSRAWLADQTNYTANAGIPPLRGAIKDKLAHRNDLHVGIDQIWVTQGATQALFQAMTLTLAAGDEVLIPNPGYTTFSMNARMLQAVPVPYRLAPERSFTPDIDELEALVTERTRLLIVNSPSNPLGAVFDEDTLRDLLAFAARHDLWVLSDEVYEAFTYGVPHVSIAALDTENRVFSAFSLSKTYAMTGIRIGYLVTPPGFTDIMLRVQEAAISCVNTPAQFAAIAAITGPQQQVGAAAEHYRGNFEAVAAVLESKGIPFLTPTGAFYLWADVSHASGGDVAAWAERFLREQHVAVAPGSAFGSAGEGWIRVCLAASRSDLVTGMGRLPARD
jgi:aspartate aminotransferase